MSSSRIPVSNAAITVVGIGADGWPGVPERLRRLILDAPVVLGGRRHLAMLPPVPGQQRQAWPSPLRANLPGLLAGLDGPVVALASGDPLVAGIGTVLLELCPPGTVRIEPAVSSVALARYNHHSHKYRTLILKNTFLLLGPNFQRYTLFQYCHYRLHHQNHLLSSLNNSSYGIQINFLPLELYVPLHLNTFLHY